MKISLLNIFWPELSVYSAAFSNRFNSEAEFLPCVMTIVFDSLEMFFVSEKYSLSNSTSFTFFVCFDVSQLLVNIIHTITLIIRTETTALIFDTCLFSVAIIFLSFHCISSPHHFLNLLHLYSPPDSH